MPECPKCRKEITYLTNFVKGWRYYSFSGGMNYQEEDFVEDDNSDSNSNYECPECDAVLFNNEQDADDFLSDNVKTEKDVCEN